MMGYYSVVNGAAQLAAERMLDSLLIGVALAVFAWGLLRALPRPNSSTRFAVWFTTLLATAFLPLLGNPQGIVGNLPSAVPPLLSVPGAWALYLFAAWMVITAIALLRIGIGFLELRRLRRSCRAIDKADPGWQATVARLCPTRRVEILTSDAIHMPTAIGFIRPAIVIPAGLRAQLSAAELNQVLLHELAHLRRWDDWTNLVQKFVKALLFFQPAVWWIETRISLEREMACDDAVLAETSSPRAYAECLATLAEKSLLRRSAALAQAAVNRIRHTSLRVAQILDVNRPRAAPARKSAVALVGLFACACLGIASRMPRLVSFQDGTPTLASAAPVQAHLLSPGHAAGVAPPPVARIAERRNLRPAVIAAKLTHAAARQQQPASVDAADRQARHARVVRAKAVVMSQPAFTSGVLIIIVDDPVFGPMPIVWHFAVWRIVPSQTVPGTIQKTT
jgi:beta-lactamase regulating signal transducer with metallopeptidase domain